MKYTFALILVFTFAFIFPSTAKAECLLSNTVITNVSLTPEVSCLKVSTKYNCVNKTVSFTISNYCNETYIYNDSQGKQIELLSYNKWSRMSKTDKDLMFEYTDSSKTFNEGDWQRLLENVDNPGQTITINGSSKSYPPKIALKEENSLYVIAGISFLVVLVVGIIVTTLIWPLIQKNK